MHYKFYLYGMDLFEKVAEKNTIYKIRASWLSIAKLYNEIAEKYNATISTAFVLLAIDEDGGTPVTKIAPRIGMEPNSLSRTLQYLEKAKLITRKKDKTDKRIVHIYLTEKGIHMREIALKAVFKLEKYITKNLADEQLKTFFEVIDHVPQAIEQFRKDMPDNEVKSKKKQA